MDLITPTCNHPDCVITLVQRDCMGRRGDKTVAFKGLGWRCTQCLDPENEAAPLEFVDVQLMQHNDAALSAAWEARYNEPLPPSGRPGRKVLEARSERVAVLLTPAEIANVDTHRGDRSRSEFLREMIIQALSDGRKVA